MGSLARLLLPGAPRLSGDLRLCPRVCPDARYTQFAGFTLAGKTSMKIRTAAVLTATALATAVATALPAYAGTGTGTSTLSPPYTVKVTSTLNPLPSGTTIAETSATFGG